MNFNTVIAILLAATFAVALAVRAWRNTNRILTERVIAARLRNLAGQWPQMDPARKAAIRANLIAAAGTPARDYLARLDEPYPLPFNVADDYRGGHR